jgi:hypothetical protein
MRVVARTLHNTTNVGFAATGSVATGLSKFLVLVLCVTYLTDRCSALFADPSHFTAGES